MNYIMCQPSIKRFEWELEVLLNNLKEHEIQQVILLFAEFDDSVIKNLKEKYPFIKVFSYSDDREDKSYIPSIKPYLWYRFLKENKTYERENFFYIDSDVIFREKINLEKYNKDDIWYGSDCNGYLNYDYIMQTQNGEQILKKMCDIVKIKPEQFKKMNKDCIGAQLIVKQPTEEFWLKVYNDSNKIWKYFSPLDSNIQKWTAEMWSQLMNMCYFNIKTKVEEEFSFSWATDDESEWKKHKIYHNAGVTESDKDLFFKGKYEYKSPFEDDLSYVNKEKCSYFYVKAIKKVRTI